MLRDLDALGAPLGAAWNAARASTARRSTIWYAVVDLSIFQRLIRTNRASLRGCSANGNTPGLHPGIRGSIPRSSIRPNQSRRITRSVSGKWAPEVNGEGCPIVLLGGSLLGEVAQLGEHHTGSVKVRGSRPLFSIGLRADPVSIPNGESAGCVGRT